VAAEVRFATELSYSLADMGELDQARRVLTEALARSEDFADPYTRIRLYWSLGRLAARQGNPTAALSSFRRAVALLEATEDTVHLARSHLSCAWILNASGRADEAVEHLTAAEHLQAWAVNVVGAVSAAGHLGPQMVDNGGGTIILTGGMPEPMPQLVSLSLGKAGLPALAAPGLRPTVLPGAVRGPRRPRCCRCPARSM